MKKTSVIAALFLAGVCWIGAGSAFAQSRVRQSSGAVGIVPDTSDQNIELFRKDVRSLRKQMIASNLDLTEAEAEKFWPIFSQYTAELAKIADKKYALLQEYAQNYTTLTDEQAESYIKGRAEVEQSIMLLRQKYVPIFRQVVSGKTTALFFQLDWRLSLIVDLQLASHIPLIE